LFFEAWEVSSLERPPDRNNLVAATEQRLNVNITIARSGARFAASLCALLIGGVTFDGSTKDAVQCDVLDALVALKAATTQAQGEATKEAQRAGIAHAKANGGARAYKGRKPSYSCEQYESAQAILGKSASVGEVARSAGPYAPNGLPHEG
jgi:hypothetical protein